MVKIWHNPRCSKSRASLEVLENSSQEITIYRYLDELPSEEDVKEILTKLGISAKELMRKDESIYKELNIKDLDNEDKLIKLLCEYPRLIQRPIIIKGDKAVIGRPIEKTIELLK